MKFKELFKCDMMPDWDKIFSISPFNEMESCQQSEKWHKEGNVRNHTIMVTESIKKLIDDLEIDKNSDRYLILMSAAICHDIGKPSTTYFDDETKTYKVYDHGRVGEKIVRRLFFDEDVIVREKVCYMVRHHMFLHHALEKFNVSDKFIEMSYGLVTLYDMAILSTADSYGSLNDVYTNEDIIKRYYQIIRLGDVELKCIDKPYRFESNYHKMCKIFNGDNDPLKLDKYGDFTIYVMVGIPGAGKDTWIKENMPDTFVICRDEIRKEIGVDGEKPQGNSEQEQQVTAIAMERLEDCCKNRRDVIINNTNVKKAYRREYIKQAIKYGANIKYIYVEPPTIEEAKRRREGMMDSKVIDSMLENLDFPYPSEYDEIIYAVQR